MKVKPLQSAHNSLLKAEKREKERKAAKGSLYTNVNVI